MIVVAREQSFGTGAAEARSGMAVATRRNGKYILTVAVV